MFCAKPLLPLTLICALLPGQAPAQSSAQDLAPGFAPMPVSCAVRALREVRVAAPVSGVIASVAVRPGQKVAEGEVLARFDSQLAEAELALAEARASDTAARDSATARIAALTSRLARLEKALRSRAVSEAEVETARLDLDLAKGELLRAEAELRFAGLEAARVRVGVEKAVIRSPVAGTVGEMLIDAGEAPDSQQPIAVITVTDPLRVEAWVPSSEVPAFLAMTSFRARIGGTERPLDFDYAAPMADISSGTISVFFTLTAPDLLPGLDCQIITPPPGGEGAKL
ncbi:efflux RND transporter periplasmic adaptor subunit [Pseudomonas sp. GX19020]|uniref:efflux RND transporter periplasmic adaptor subunit n=1 Tax=Pseudomonas sp. GX19020 TaxID=2942277 RepID=UPI002019537C|nr:efflux RND transporter periplasmic adaptor subunit [Pseudomonas sp. GX19020]MCL4069183.1 efflux RND transporter periplasmic adaptor subunit [Pseudomonas sp. GX19020]